MPLYEYVCEQDGEVIELLRPAAEADKPVNDPAGRGRTFRRRHSTFQAKASAGAPSRSLPLGGGCCPCGDPSGPCNAR